MAMMNLGELITSMKMDLGIYGTNLPFKEGDKIFYDTIKLKTLKTFSQFYPHIMQLDLKMSEFKAIKSNFEESIFEFPLDLFGGRQVMYIRKVDQRNQLLGGSQYIDPFMMDDGIELYDAVLMGQASANLTSTVLPPFTFKFIQPNRLVLYNMSTMATDITIEFAVEHFENLSTISNTSWESFQELALLDIKRMLYNTFKHYNEIQTAYGTINMRIDDWANAEQDRKELIEKWRDMYHLDADQFIIV